jgi:hypothetical protein
VSIMPTRILPQHHPENPAAPSQIITCLRAYAIHLL